MMPKQTALESIADTMNLQPKLRAWVLDLLSAAYDAGRESANESFHMIANLGGNLPDDRLMTRTGPNDAVARGVMYVAARNIALAGLISTPPVAPEVKP